MINKPSVASIILAAGKGTRINSQDKNKVAYPFLSKPLVAYGVELFQKISKPVVVVVGAFEESVRDVLKDYPEVIFVRQKDQLGTGDATKAGLKALVKNPPSLVLVGMGDHMMFYKPKTIEKLIEVHKAQKAMVTFISTRYDRPEGYGRVERDKNGQVVDVVEEKDSTDKQKKIKEINAGLYCFNYEFLKKEIYKIKKSPVNNEYYLTDIILRAFKDKLKVIGMPVRFRQVGIGINRQDELEESQQLFKKIETLI